MARRICSLIHRVISCMWLTSYKHSYASFWSRFKNCINLVQIVLNSIYTVRLCRIQQAYDRPTTWLRTYTTIVSELWVWFTRNNSRRGPVVSLSNATKSYRVNRPLAWNTFICDVLCNMSFSDVLENLQADLHGTTLSNTTSLRKAYDMNCFL